MSDRADQRDQQAETGDAADAQREGVALPRDISKEKMDRIRTILFGKDMQNVQRELSRLDERLKQEAAGLRDEMARRLSSLEDYARGEIAAALDQIKAERGKREEAVAELSDQMRESTSELGDRIDDLAAKSAKGDDEVRALLDRRIRDEQNARVESMSELDDKLDAAVGTLDGKIEALDARVSEERDALRQEIDQRIQGEQKSRQAAFEKLASSLSEAEEAFDREIAGVNARADESERNLRDQILNLSKSLSQEIRERFEALQKQIDRAVAQLQHDKMDRYDLASMLGELSMRITNELDELDLPDE